MLAPGESVIAPLASPATLVGELSHAEFISRVAQLYPGYEASEYVMGDIRARGTHLTTVTAPTAMGKDYVRNGAVRIANEKFGINLHVVVGDTDRDPREDEQEGVDYNFRQHERAEVIEEVRRGGYVQIGMGAGDSFYGTRPRAYPPNAHAVLDIVAEQIEVMRALPFASFGAAYIIAPYDSWMARIQASRSFTPQQWQKRRREAMTSLTAGLEDEAIVHIVNEGPDIAAETLVTFALHREFDKKQAAIARNLAATVLRQLKQAA